MVGDVVLTESQKPTDAGFRLISARRLAVVAVKRRHKLTKHVVGW